MSPIIMVTTKAGSPLLLGTVPNITIKIVYVANKQNYLSTPIDI